MSGNYKDVLTSFFQVAVDNLTGSNKELKFASNPFAIMLKANPSLSLDKNYIKYKALRNLNFSFDAKLDSNYHFNGFASSITYALINRRDYTVYDQFIDLVLLKNRDYHLLHEAIAIAINGISDTVLRKKVREQELKLFNTKGFTFDQLDDDVKTIILQAAKDDNLNSFVNAVKSNPELSIADSAAKNFNDVKNSFQNKHLLTIGVADTTYNDGFFFQNVLFSAESVKGFLKPENSVNLQWDIKVNDLLGNDSLKTSRNLNRQILNIEPGINLIIKNKSNQQSLVEFKLSGSYNHILNGLHANESKDSTTINGTLRIRIINDLWIPLEIKYDPKNGNVFGFLNVRLNFTGLNKKQKNISSLQ